MKENDPINILKFWKAIEQFTPVLVETEKKPSNVSSIQKEVLGEKDIPWLNHECFQHIATKTHTWHYTVFLGIIKSYDIISQMKGFLGSDYPDYDMRKTGGISCLCAFQLNINGLPIRDSFEIPDYFIAMSCLARKKHSPKNWLEMTGLVKESMLDAFTNLYDRLHHRTNPKPLSFEELKAFLEDIITLSEWRNLTSDGLIRNTAIVYSSNIPLPKPLKDNSAEEEKEPTTTILNSFFIDDLQTLIDEMENHRKIGKGVEDYLAMSPQTERKDFCDSTTFLEEYSSPHLLPPARWPCASDHPLSLAQQVSVNIALSEKEGIFSINGPPGTGKSTLLRDIISGVLFERAASLAKLRHPEDAFIKSVTTKIDGYNYKAWKLKPELLGHEIVVASSNNGAVENISKEIPRRSEIDHKWDLNYFSEIASHISDEESWGIGAATLGNKKNRMTFFNSFWSKKPSDKADKSGDPTYGLHYLLQNLKPTSDWEKARERFKSAAEKYSRIQHILMELKQAIQSHAQQQSEKKKREHELLLHKENMKDLQKRIDTLLVDQQSLESQHNKQLALIDAYRSAKPSWFMIIVAFFTKDEIYKGWKKEYLSLVHTLQEITLKDRTILNQLESLNKKHLDAITTEDRYIKMLEKLEKEINQHMRLITTYSALMKEHFPDDTFWNKPDNLLHTLSPWLFEEMHHIRATLLIEAMHLHESFIINASEKLMNNLRCMNFMMTRGTWPAERSEMLPNIWASFFMVVPVVSTTFASFSNLFKDMRRESIGWLLIDEAGQATPQAAMGAIYRARRSVVVGDPLQIPPVVTIPKAMNNALLDYYKITERWSPLQESVQTLADRVNPYGTYIGKSNNKRWVGSPLRVHRRCNDPIFNVANKIAYDNLMIQATRNKTSSIETFIKENLWIHIEGLLSDGHWLAEEGDAVLEILSFLTASLKRLPPLYIISPFNTTASMMRQHLKDHITKWCHTECQKDRASMYCTPFSKPYLREYSALFSS